MSNDFSKEEIVAFEDVTQQFTDKLVMSNLVRKYNTSAQQMERSNNTILRPVPYIGRSYDGTDATGNFNDAVQLSVPAQINISKHSTVVLDANELNDQLQEGRLGQAAASKLASDINVSAMNVAANQGSLVVKRTSAATGFDDVAQIEAIMNEQGIDYDERKLALSTRDYNGMANNLAGRETLSGKALTAYEKAFVGRVASFDTYKLDYANSLTAAAGTSVTINGANQYYTPQATRTAATGEWSNIDNRYQELAITVGGGTVAVGDCFTIAGVNAVHHITKQSTGQLKTFRITSLLNSAGGTGTVQISPPIISGTGGTAAEVIYQNVDAAPANGAAITFLNTTTASVNPFWHKDAIEILPGSYKVPENAGAAVMSMATDNGFQLTFQKQYDINTMKTKYRFDVFYGVTMVNPEMAGVILFGQS